MTDVEQDPIVRRAIDELRTMPAANAEAMQRVIAAAAAARVAPAADDPMVLAAPRRARISLVAAGFAAAAVVVGLFAVNNRGATDAVVARSSTRVAASAATVATPLQSVASNAGDALPVLEQFVFYSRTARNVSVVGDFNGWDAASARMTRASDGDIWSITMPVTPGRHMYGFMVDDSSFVLDPHAQTARDTDLGTTASVIVVGKP